jgi:hypothetical protein
MPFGVRGVPSVLMCRCRVISAWRVACPIPDVASAMHALSPARHIPDTAGCACLSWAHFDSLKVAFISLASSAHSARFITARAHLPCQGGAGARVIHGRSLSSVWCRRWCYSRALSLPPFTSQIGGSAPFSGSTVHLPHRGIRARSDRAECLSLLWALLGVWSCASAPALAIFLGIPDSRCAGVPFVGARRFVSSSCLSCCSGWNALYHPHPLTLTPPVHLPNWGIGASLSPGLR